MSIGWYYSKELNPSDQSVDEFSDSKFGIDKWTSFAREIIQNSLDAQDDEKKPVEVYFDLNKNLTLDDIPGGRRVKEILQICAETATNKQTKGRYNKGLELLSKDNVYCLKIADKNTIGVKTGRDEAWGALVFDEGKSVKQRPGSAGSHGVGKKVPFIISSCNTVFYATKNKYKIGEEERSDCLFQGKTTLITWSDEKGIRRNKKGWYGTINENDADPRNAILPIVVNDEEHGINPYFLRKDEYGTDVIIMGANIYEDEDRIKRTIISAILENFFVAILEGKLVVRVFDVDINAISFQEVAQKYYEEAADNIKNNLYGCLRVYSAPPQSVNDIYDGHGNKIGTISIYFGLGNEHNKKYYTVVRSHGMRIVDYRINNASQPYTAVVFVDGKELNSKLASLENAAHDSFVTRDENLEIDEEAVNALNQIKNTVAEFVIEKTKIDEMEGQDIDGLSNIITMPGIISSVRRKSGLPSIKKNKMSHQGTGSHNTDYGEGKTGVGSGDKKKRKRKGKRSPAKKGSDFDSILFEEYALEPLIIKQDNKYVLKVSTNIDVTNGELRISSINSEGKQDNTIADYIDGIVVERQSRKCENGVVKNLSFKKDKLYSIIIKLKKNVTYQLKADLYVKEDKE